MDIVKVLDAAKKRLNLRSDREYSLHMKKAHNYVHMLREGQTPSPEALSVILRDAGMEPDLEVLRFMKEQHGGDVKRIIDRAIKALSAASLGIAALVIATGAPPAQATVSNSDQPSNYTLCDN